MWSWKSGILAARSLGPGLSLSPGPVPGRPERVASVRSRRSESGHVACADVRLQVAGGVGPVAAEGAAVGLLSRMGPEVLLEVVAPPRPVVAVGAREQGVLRVLLHVAAEVRLARGGEAAQHAVVGGEGEVGGGGGGRGGRGRRLLLLLAG